MKNYTLYIVSLLAAGLFLSLSWKNEWVIAEDTTVAQTLTLLGENPAPHQPRYDLPGVSAEKGAEIVLYGRTTDPNGGKSDRVSKHFVCTSCHNVERDEPDLSKSDPEARLRYVAEKGLPFLQGSALYGAVDRRSFYNGDYEKKYGDLVKPARHDLRQAIQLCATECAQGRLLEDWELESVLAYLWTIGLKVEDLDLTETERKRVSKSIAAQQGQGAALNLVHSKFQLGYPATFLDPPADRRQGATGTGNPERGRQLYELSCLHCHEDQRYSFFNLDESELTYDFLEKHIGEYTRYSIYQVARYGTSPVPGKRAYMPHYTQEKMSVQMLEDLRAFIEQEAD